MLNQPDTLLVTFLNSVSAIESENALADLLVKQIEPTIKKTLRGKLHASLKENDFSQNNQDALEIASEVKLILIAELGLLKSNANGKSIHNLNSFVASVTTNAYHQYLRAKYPLRQQFKNKLRYLLTHHQRFALWEDGQNRWLSGFKDWSNRNDQFESPPAAETIRAKIAETAGSENLSHAARTIDLLIFIFDIARAPILFNELVSIVADVHGVKDQKEMSEDESNQIKREKVSVSSDDNTAAALEHREHLRKVWAEIGELPLRHRAALLLNLKDRQGDALVWLFPILRVASVKQIAEILEFPPEEFAAVWRELPWEDTKIAERLNLTRQQVINLRQSARARLVRLFALK
ncbi:MAG: hypothetical protein LH472_11960 [Pyrinomonadaceae bacterium]|nr:hypothetical protein [Pyrinomonadaceae bacterium]